MEEHIKVVATVVMTVTKDVEIVLDGIVMPIVGPVLELVLEDVKAVLEVVEEVVQLVEEVVGVLEKGTFANVTFLWMETLLIFEDLIEPELEGIQSAVGDIVDPLKTFLGKVTTPVEAAIAPLHKEVVSTVSNVLAVAEQLLHL